MTGILIGTIAALFALLAWAFHRQREIYEQLFSVLERDRDEAKHEAKVFRGLAFPVMLKVESREEAAGAVVSQQPLRNDAAQAPPASSGLSTKLNPFFNRRSPFRIRFNKMRALTNSKQQKTDALAAALENAKPPRKEPAHANG